jgi:HPt (histidine-containing phosphotransfer) domain-containing protein
MDTQMPGLSGSELISALRERSAARIIAISGSEVSETIRTACDGFLLKPVGAEELAALLESSSDGAADLSFENAFNGISDPANKADAADRHASGSDSVIDPPTLARLTAMMPAASVREIYDAVATDMEKRLVLLEKAMLAQDSAEVARIAHSVKGGSAMVGFKMATEAAGRLETSNRSETWPEELAQLRRALLELERILGGEFPT